MKLFLRIVLFVILFPLMLAVWTVICATAKILSYCGVKDDTDNT